MIISQYDIVIVNLDPTIGSEIKKTRPCIVVSPNEINHNLKTVIVAPVTSKSKKYPTRVAIKVNSKTNFVVLDQIRTIDKKRIFKQIGKLSRTKISEIKNIIKQMLVD